MSFGCCGWEGADLWVSSLSFRLCCCQPVHCSLKQCFLSGKKLFLFNKSFSLGDVCLFFTPTFGISFKKTKTFLAILGKIQNGILRVSTQSTLAHLVVFF
ncbi:hypothetical protein XELAEV_18041686mg [Xenopus laevis]|uniref:Uncharacterized protein n=1 Tax=Xenopus laevis TaxID=8355 RepID=A0A974H5S2_XENLA|nr:hypothetical protein XELAEV_18041686mg [Xenopus laevis]